MGLNGGRGSRWSPLAIEVAKCEKKVPRKYDPARRKTRHRKPATSPFRALLLEGYYDDVYRAFHAAPE